MNPSNEDLTRLDHVEAAGAGQRVGPYRLIREIGRGGMGTVYLAVRSDDVFQKRVAIKILDRGTHSASIVGRFRTERQILASLEHPNIAGLLDGGTTPDGSPYFAMEYVEGQPISDFCESRPLDTTGRLQLFRKVCGAVQYAHQNLIIHRDIKPANVLVTADGTPKLLDFGIAKLLNPELGAHALAPTMIGAQLMTPEYASPEQVRGEPVTTATDVYSLGVLLYELLTGQPPYRLNSRAPAEVARVVCEAVPVRPSTVVTTIRYVPAAGDAVTQADRGASPGGLRISTGPRAAVDTERLRRRLAGDLDTIVLKALSKEPSRRYASVDQFSEDIHRHLRGLPVIARKDTLGYRASKFVHRNRAAVVAGVLTFAALVGGIVATTWQARVARGERARAEQRFDEIRGLANSSLFEIHDAIRDLPGSTPARQMLVANGLAYLDRLARDAGDRPDLMRELAGAYVKVGDVQGRPLNPNLGDSAGALASYRKAASIYESLGAGTDATSHRRGLATAYIRLSEVLGRTGETAEALSFARKALDLLTQAAQAPPPDATVQTQLRRELAASHSRVGDLLSASGDTNGALEQHRLALAMMEPLAAAAPNDVDNLRQLGVAHQKLANSLGNPNYPNIGDFPGALDHLQRSAKVFQAASVAHPTNALFRRLLAVVNSNTADVLLALKRPDEALASQRRASVEFAALSAADPSNAAASNDLAISQSKIAEMLDANGRSREAVREYERALAIHQSLSAADPGNDSMKLEVASDYNRLATVQAKLKDRAASLSNHARALELARSLAAANPANVELRVALALALAGRGDAHVLFVDLAAAERDYVEAVDLLSALDKQGVIQGTDLETLRAARAELDRIRRQRGLG